MACNHGNGRGVPHDSGECNAKEGYTVIALRQRCGQGANDAAFYGLDMGINWVGIDGPMARAINRSCQHSNFLFIAKRYTRNFDSVFSAAWCAGKCSLELLKLEIHNVRAHNGAPGDLAEATARFAPDRS